MNGKMLLDFDSPINDFAYQEGEEVTVTDLEGFPKSYAVYKDGSLDWIPKTLVEVA